MTTTDSKAGMRLNDGAGVSPGGRDQSDAAPVGEWPEPVPRGPLILSGLLWLAWAGFMLWMAILRIESSRS